MDLNKLLIVRVTEGRGVDLHRRSMYDIASNTDDTVFRIVITFANETGPLLKLSNCTLLYHRRTVEVVQIRF